MDTSLLNRYINSNTCEDFSRWRIFPNVKEIMESFACLRALESLSIPLEGKLIMVIGDGVKPRTALTCAYYGHFNRKTCKFLSIDPNLRTPWVRTSIGEPYYDPSSYPDWLAQTKELELFRGRAEQWAPDEDDLRFIQRDIIMICPHSHAPLLEVVHNLEKHGAKELHIISLPCCVADNLGPPDKTWTDKDLHQHTPKATFNYYHLS